MTNSSIFEELSQKLESLIKYLQQHPTQVLQYVLVGLGGITALWVLGCLIDVIAMAISDRRQRRSGVTLKILPSEGNNIKETEALLKNIHGILLNTKWRKIINGRPYMSFEIVAEKVRVDVKGKAEEQDRIAFYVWVPENYKNMIMERIYSTYPNVSIKEYKEAVLPKKLHRKQEIYGTEVELGYHHMLKISTKRDRDIIPSILSNLKNLQWHEKAIVQILVRPLDNHWQLAGRKVLEEYEYNNRRPMKRGSIAQWLSDLGKELGKEIEEITEQKGTIRKSRADRREIRVGSEKIIESGFETVIRIVCIGAYRKANRARVKAISAAFNELDQENRFMRKYIVNKRKLYRRARIRKMYVQDKKNILTTSELGNFMLRLPDQDIIELMPEIERPVVKELPPPPGVEKERYILGVNQYRGVETPIGLKDKDLERHAIIQGATGSGKSEFAKTVLIPHFKLGRGAMIIEPHGKLSDELLQIMPPERIKDVVWFDLFDDYPPPFNFCKIFNRPGQSFEDVAEKTVEEILEIFATKFRDTWSGKNEHYLANALKTIVELQEGGIPDVQRLLTDNEFREYAMRKVKDPQTRQFWETEFTLDKKGKLQQGTESTVLSLSHKLGKFLNSKKILRSVGQSDCIDFLDILNKNKIIIFRFSKDNMSEDRIKFFGSVAIKLLIVAAYQRDKSKWSDPFMVLLDEAQNFLTPSIKTVIYELRKFGISLWPMHQGLEQLDKEEGLREALYTNVGTIITFMTGMEDAPYFEKIHKPRITAKEIEGLASRYGYVKTLINGVKTPTFNIYTLDSPQPDKEKGPAIAEEIKVLNRNGRKHYKEIDRDLNKRFSHYREIEDNEDFKVRIDDGFYDEEYEDEIIEVYRDEEFNDSDIELVEPAAINGTKRDIDAGDEEYEFEIQVDENRIKQGFEGESKKRVQWREAADKVISDDLQLQSDHKTAGHGAEEFLVEDLLWEQPRSETTKVLTLGEFKKRKSADPGADLWEEAKKGEIEERNKRRNLAEGQDQDKQRQAKELWEKAAELEKKERSK